MSSANENCCSNEYEPTPIENIIPIASACNSDNIQEEVYSTTSWIVNDGQYTYAQPVSIHGYYWEPWSSPSHYIQANPWLCQVLADHLQQRQHSGDSLTDYSTVQSSCCGHYCSLPHQQMDPMEWNVVNMQTPPKTTENTAAYPTQNHDVKSAQEKAYEKEIDLFLNRIRMSVEDKQNLKEKECTEIATTSSNAKKIIIPPGKTVKLKDKDKKKKKENAEKGRSSKIKKKMHNSIKEKKKRNEIVKKQKTKLSQSKISKIEKQLELVENEIKRRKMQLKLKEMQIQSEIKIIKHKRNIDRLQSEFLNAKLELDKQSYDGEFNQCIDNRFHEDIEYKCPLKSIIHVVPSKLPTKCSHRRNTWTDNSRTKRLNNCHPYHQKCITKDIPKQEKSSDTCFINANISNVNICSPAKIDKVMEEQQPTQITENISVSRIINNNESNRHEIELTIRVMNANPTILEEANKDQDACINTETNKPNINNDFENSSSSDLSFLDDINVDDIVECLNITDKMSQAAVKITADNNDDIPKQSLNDSEMIKSDDQFHGHIFDLTQDKYYDEFHEIMKMLNTQGSQKVLDTKEANRCLISESTEGRNLNTDPAIITCNDDILIKEDSHSTDVHHYINVTSSKINVVDNASNNNIDKFEFNDKSTDSIAEKYIQDGGDTVEVLELNNNVDCISEYESKNILNMVHNEELQRLHFTSEYGVLQSSTKKTDNEKSQIRELDDVTLKAREFLTHLFGNMKKEDCGLPLNDDSNINSYTKDNIHNDSNGDVHILQTLDLVQETPTGTIDDVSGTDKTEEHVVVNTKASQCPVNPNEVDITKNKNKNTNITNDDQMEIKNGISHRQTNNITEVPQLNSNEIGVSELENNHDSIICENAVPQTDSETTSLCSNDITETKNGISHRQTNNTIEVPQLNSNEIGVSELENNHDSIICENTVPQTDSETTSLCSNDITEPQSENNTTDIQEIMLEENKISISNSDNYTPREDSNKDTNLVIKEDSQLESQAAVNGSCSKETDTQLNSKKSMLSIVPLRNLIEKKPNFNLRAEKYEIPRLGKRLSQFLLTKVVVNRIIHTGQYSDIYQCQTAKGLVFAAKFIKPRLGTLNMGMYKVDMFKRMQESIPLEKQNCVYLFDGLSVLSRWCYLFQYFPRNLEQALKVSGPLHIDTIQHLARQLISAVLHIRNNNVVHADIKPSHILMNNNYDNLKLCGFDEAYTTQSVRFASCLGTVHYRAPEVILGHSMGHSLDVWSTAAVLHEMATNRKLFPGTTNNEVLYQQLCTFGNPPANMMFYSAFSQAHFIENRFVRRCYVKNVQGEIQDNTKYISSFQPTPRVKAKLFEAYHRTWGARLNHAEFKKLRSFEQLLKKMLVIDPAYRLTIEFAYAHEFIYQ